MSSDKEKKKVFVAMSGGVDSSVSAALLKKEGYDVTGVFIDVWQPDFVECSRGDDKREAMRAAAHIGIPFLAFDFEKEYKKHVVDYMIAEYRAGRTPNPDVMCNRHIKFGAFLRKALEMDADCIATGHYARILAGEKSVRERERAKSGKPCVKTVDKNLQGRALEMLMGVDKNKDQSYFLWTLTQAQLQYMLFPIGELTKPEVRTLAQKFKLPNAERKESQGVCFIGEFDMKNFLKNYILEKRGDVLNDKGEIIGFHEGSSFYTIGERHGFTVTSKSPNDPPLYIVAKDLKNDTITVSSRKIQKETARSELEITDINFISGEIPVLDKNYEARIRYRQPLQNCRIQKSSSKKLKVIFNQPQKAITPGQSLVLYGGEVCLGGGIIA